jgi:hypothetical protein
LDDGRLRFRSRALPYFNRGHGNLSTAGQIGVDSRLAVVDPWPLMAAIIGVVAPASAKRTMPVRRRSDAAALKDLLSSSRRPSRARNFS